MKNELIENHVVDVEYRIGALEAVRKDLDGETEFSDKSDVNLTANIGVMEEAFRAEMTLVQEGPNFRLRVTLAGTWTCPDMMEFQPEQIQLFARTIALPRLLAAAQAQLSVLSSQINVGAPAFSFSIDSGIRTKDMVQGTAPLNTEPN